jgi:hypothetical protein
LIIDYWYPKKILHFYFQLHMAPSVRTFDCLKITGQKCLPWQSGPDTKNMSFPLSVLYSLVDLRYHSSKVEFVRLIFERNVGLKKSFQLCLTFIKNSLWTFISMFSQCSLSNASFVARKSSIFAKKLQAMELFLLLLRELQRIFVVVFLFQKKKE